MQPFVEESKEVPCSEPEVGSASDLPPTSSATTGSHSKKLNVITQAKAHICHSCKAIIRDQSFLNIDPETYFHQSCLQCCICHESFAEGKKCHFKNGNAYCTQDYIKIVGVSCFKCCKKLLGDEKVVPVSGKFLHLKCFTCKVCGNTPQPREEMAISDKEILCEMHMLDNREEIESCDTSVKEQQGDEEKGNEGDKKKSSGKKSRQRTVLTEDQLATLKYYYNHIDRKPSAALKEQICKKTSLSMRVVRVWFQNKRCKEKKDKLREEGMQAVVGPLGMSPPFLQSTSVPISSYFYQQRSFMMPAVDTIPTPQYQSFRNPYAAAPLPQRPVAYGPPYGPISPHNPHVAATLPVGTPPTSSPSYYTLSNPPSTYSGNSPLEATFPTSIHNTCDNGGIGIVDMNGQYRPTIEAAQLPFS
jgi:hypothetical protein